LIKYALLLKGPYVIVLGLDSIEIVNANLEILRNFKPLDEIKMMEMALVTPLYNHQGLPWTEAG